MKVFTVDSGEYSSSLHLISSCERSLRLVSRGEVRGAGEQVERPELGPPLVVDVAELPPLCG